MLLANLKGLRASATLAVALAVAIGGCSTSSGTSDLDAAAEASHPPPRHLDASFDTGIVGDAGPDASGFDQTTGQMCMNDTDCSTGPGRNRCTIANFFNGGPIFPTPVCMLAEPCNPGTDGFIHFCDGPDISTSKGICIPSQSSPTLGTCYPQCRIPPDGSAPIGCQGLDRCQPFAAGFNNLGQPLGIGICFGGCTSDADCPMTLSVDGAAVPSKCQKDEGVCLTTLTTRTKQLGQTCSVNDVSACSCFRNNTTSVGYCTQFCIVGLSSPAPCPTGYACDAQLPAQLTNPMTDATVAGFTTQNAGLEGSCLQSCGAGGAGDSGANPAADAGSDSGGDAVSEASSEAGSDGAGTGQVAASCPVTASCSTMDAVGPVCIP